jgi:hypothetical protein
MSPIPALNTSSHHWPASVGQVWQGPEVENAVLPVLHISDQHGIQAPPEGDLELADPRRLGLRLGGLACVRDLQFWSCHFTQFQVTLLNPPHSGSVRKAVRKGPP